MLCKIDNGALQRSSCFTCGSPQQMAKECPSRLSRGPGERAVRFKDNYKDLPEAWIRRHAIIRFCMGCLDLEAGQHACIQQPKSFEEAMDKIEWFQCINKTSKSRRPSSKAIESDPPVNAYTCKSYDDNDTDSCSDEEEDESVGYLLSTSDTKQNISPYSSIYRTDSGLIPRNESPQSGTSTPGLTEVARQMSKVSDEMSTLCSNVSDLTSGIKNMLCEIDNGALQRSSCFTCGSPQHMAKECPSRLSRGPGERAVRFKDNQPKANGTKK